MQRLCRGICPLSFLKYRMYCQEVVETKMDLKKAFKHISELVTVAGEHLLKASLQRRDFTIKSRPQDLVTKTDLEVQDILLSGLRKHYADHKYISEEDELAAGHKLTNAPTWIIDPIDGTMNFVHGLPFSCISVALFIDRKPELAIVFSPMLNQRFTAQRGQGAFLNGKPIRVSDKRELRSSMILNEYNLSNLAPPEMEITICNLSKLLNAARALRATGSGALNMCLVAQGVVDAYYEFAPHIWDIAAGVLLVLEAGGVVRDPCGTELDVMSRRVLATSTPQLACELTSLLGDAQIYHIRDDQPPQARKPK